MASETGIGWTDATVNFWIGCTRCGPGCDGCYAAAWAYGKWGIVFEPGGERRPTKAGFNDPLKWQRAHEAGKRYMGSEDNQVLVPRWVFCNSLSDFFDKEAPPELRARAWTVIEDAAMIVTEEEAKTKRCQETFGPPIQLVGSGFFTASPPTSNCIGSACMAWRYFEAVPKIEIFVQGETDADYVARRDRVMAVLTGYCGKAGRP